MARRRAPRYEWPVAVSLLVCLTGLVVTVLNGWRTGMVVFGSGVLLAGVLRMLLSDDDAGLLRVRQRLFDVPALLGMGVVVLTLAFLVPDRLS